MFFSSQFLSEQTQRCSSGEYSSQDVKITSSVETVMRFVKPKGRINRKVELQSEGRKTAGESSSRSTLSLKGPVDALAMSGETL